MFIGLCIDVLSQVLTHSVLTVCSWSLRAAPEATLGAKATHSSERGAGGAGEKHPGLIPEVANLTPRLFTGPSIFPLFPWRIKSLYNYCKNFGKDTKRQRIRAEPTQPCLPEAIANWQPSLVTRRVSHADTTAAGPWARNLVSQASSFLICKMRMTEC